MSQERPAAADTVMVPPSACHAIAAHSFRETGRWWGRFGDLKITSAFQPIFSITHRRPVGYEGLMRAQTDTGAPVSPPDAFRRARDVPECVFLDRLCRLVHIRNVLDAGEDTGWLFLNVSPLVSIHGRDHGSYFAELLAEHGLSPNRVVIEILESAIEDREQLVPAADYYRDLGCLVAIDDFGAGHSNFDRIWRLQPHIVKMDRNTIEQAAQQRQVRRLLPNLVSLLHESGSLVVMEGIETEEQALIAMDAGIDFAQGYYFGRPTSAPTEADASFPDGLCDRFRAFATGEALRYRRELRHYEQVFETAARRIAAGQPPQAACQELLCLPRVERCFMLDGDGHQLGDNLMAKRTPDPRFQPLAEARGAVWSRKPYFRRAIAEPDRVQVTRPYLSLTGANMCVTLSIQLPTATGPRVYCVDLDWPA